MTLAAMEPAIAALKARNLRGLQGKKTGLEEGEMNLPDRILTEYNRKTIEKHGKIRMKAEKNHFITKKFRNYLMFWNSPEELIFKRSSVFSLQETKKTTKKTTKRY